jgi:hypothetical protein
MANDFKNTSLVTKFAVKDFLNELQLGKKVDRQLDEKNVFSGKTGSTVYVRRPVMFTVESGAAISSHTDIEEAYIPVACTTQQHVSFIITSADMTLKIEDANERYIKPAMIELAQKVDMDIAAQYYNIPNFVGTPGTKPSTFLHIAAAKAALNRIGVPDDGDRCAFFGSEETNYLADGLKGAFSQDISKEAIKNARFGRYASFDCYENNVLSTHTVGVATGTPLVKGASQNVTYATSKDTDTQSLITDGWTTTQTGILKAGDVFTIAGVYEVNRRTGSSTGNLMRFTVLADANSDGSGNATFSIAPAIITSGPYQTVSAAPADDAAITVVSGTGGTSYLQNLAFHKNAITLAVAQLDTPSDGVSSSRFNWDGISIRSTKQYDITNDRTVFRFDILYGIKVQNRNFACRITS